MTHRGARALHRRADAARDGDMVVLDQHRVIQPEPVVAAPAYPQGVFLCGAQARHGFPGAADARFRARDRADDRGGRRGDAAEMAEEVQRHALGGQNAPSRPGDLGDDIPRHDA